MRHAAYVFFRIISSGFNLRSSSRIQVCINLNLDLFQHYSIYSTKVLREIQNAFFNKYSLSIDHTCYLIPVIEYIYTHNRVIHLPQILLYFLITVIKIMCFTITAVRCNSINRIAYCNNSCTYRYICSCFTNRITLPVKTLMVHQNNV